MREFRAKRYVGCEFREFFLEPLAVAEILVQQWRKQNRPRVRAVLPANQFAKQGEMPRKNYSVRANVARTCFPPSGFTRMLKLSFPSPKL